jgi:hypothetical protein
MPSAPKDQGEKPEPPMKTDSIDSAVEAHLQRHAMLRLGR